MWTKEQQEAIYKNNTNILVSAGAGSGKTAVLSERILNIVKNGIHIDELLVLTFTKAAALEMKERIKKKLEKENLTDEIFRLTSANISTYDTFTLSLVKEYYYLLGLKKDIKILDESIIEYEKTKIIDKYFEDLYEKNDLEFYDFLSHYSLKDDKDIKKIFISLSKKIDLLYDKDLYLDNYINNYLNKQYYDILSDSFIDYILNKKTELLDLFYNYLEALKNSDNDYDTIKLENIYYELQHISKYDDILNYIIKIEYPKTKNQDETVKEAKEIFSLSVNELKDILEKYESKQSMIDELISIEKDIIFIINTYKKIDDEISKFKKEANAYSFNDILRFSIKLLDIKTVKDNLKFHEILVDEYQDTSDLQELLLQKLSNNNLYQVGDIKQSIYRFRNSNPDIFKKKYNSYKSFINGIKIDLIHNFRSRKEVLDDINILFNNIMTIDVGDVEYSDGHQMVFGNLNYNNHKKENNNLEILSYNIDSLKEFNEENKLLISKDELESFIVANKIKLLIDNKYQVYDNKLEKLRDIKYCDIAIIVSKSTKFDLIKKILEYNNIPVFIDKAVDILDNDFILSILSLLELTSKIIKNIYDIDFKRAYTSFLRSFIINKNDEEIYKLIKAKDYYNQDIILIIKEVIKNSDSHVLLYYNLLEKFDVYNKLYSIGNIKINLEIINYIKNIIMTFTSINYDLDEIFKYIDFIKKTGKKLEFNDSSQPENSIKIMTIHHSKGLEYPVCIFPYLSSKFNIDEIKEKFGFDNDYQIFIPSYQNGLKDTIVKYLIKEKRKKELISEQMRLFYVAITRAKEKIILTLELKEKENNRSLNSFASFIYKNSNIKKDSYTLIDTSKENLTNKYKEKKNNFKLKGNIKNIVYKTYNKEYIKEIKKDVSISVDEIGISNKLKEGIKFHKYFEIINLKNPDYNIIKDQYTKDIIKNVLSLEIFKNIKNANIFKELKFIFYKNENKYFGIIDLLLEFENEIYIIDYKLSNIDKSGYVDQLRVYKDYVLSLNLGKKIKTFLLSITNKSFKEVTNDL